jgi:predicted ATPase
MFTLIDTINRLQPLPLNVVLTGGPCAGKTSLINRLKTLGFNTIPEQAIRVIDRLQSEMGATHFCHWRRRHPFEFQEMILQAQRNAEEITQKDNMTFLDRGRLDGLAYLSHHGVGLSHAFQDKALISTFTYRVIVNCETLTTFAERKHTGRNESKNESSALFKALGRTYASHGYTVLPLPSVDLEVRLSLMLNALARLLGE